VRRLSRQTQKAPAGEDRGFCGLSVCRSNKPIRIVGGHNDAAKRMLPFYQNCNSYSGKLTTNCIHRTKTGPTRQWLTEPAPVFALACNFPRPVTVGARIIAWGIAARGSTAVASAPASSISRQLAVYL
jgi:hypothetical protein